VALLLACSLCTTVLGVPQDPPEKQATKSAAKSRIPEYALIFGTVWDTDNHPAFGVHVLLRRSGEKKVRWEAFSDHRGEFAFRVPTGKMDYELEADEKSIKLLKNNKLGHAIPVKIHVEFDERVDTGLHLMQ
jgi:hypothetical protein